MRASMPLGPKGSPVLGHTLSLSHDPLAFLRASTVECGDLIPLQVLWRQVLFVNHPDYIADVLVTNHRKVVKGMTRRSDFLLLGDGITLNEGDAWRHERRLIQPAFHRERIATYGRDVVMLAKRLLGEWHDGEVRDIGVEMNKLSMAVIGKTVLGIDASNEASDLSNALASVLTCRSAHARSLSMLLPDWLPTPMKLRLRYARRGIDNILQRFIDRRRTANDDRDDVLSALLRARDRDGQGLRDQHVRNEIVTIFVGGHETLTDLLSWTWYLLSRYPAVEAKLLAELDATLGDRLPGVSDVPHLSYAGMLISEVLRLYPPASVLTREAATDLEIGRYRVARGTEVVVSPWVMQRDPRYFTDPEVFDPDRWSDGLANRLPRYAYFPFGAGPRLCLGRSFATMVAILALTVIAQRFRLDLVPGLAVVADPIPTLHPKPGLPMVVRSRERDRAVYSSSKVI